MGVCNFGYQTSCSANVKGNMLTSLRHMAQTPNNCWDCELTTCWVNEGVSLIFHCVRVTNKQTWSFNVQVSNRSLIVAFVVSLIVGIYDLLNQWTKFLLSLTLSWVSGCLLIRSLAKVAFSLICRCIIELRVTRFTECPIYNELFGSSLLFLC